MVALSGRRGESRSRGAVARPTRSGLTIPFSVLFVSLAGDISFLGRARRDPAQF